MRASNGSAALINDTHAAQLMLPAEKQRLTFHGADIPDMALLWNVGVRTDDIISLEFESPCEPSVLKLLRAPVVPKEKKAKGGKGGKKKK